MKKILIATTALVATAGVAAAEVTLDGYGRFGLIYNEGNDLRGEDKTNVEQRFRLTITGITETDAGVKFEGRIRFQTDDQRSGGSNVAQRSAAGFAVTAGGFRLDVGNVSDVIDSGDVVDYFGYGVGLTSFAEQSSAFLLPVSGFGTSGDDSTTSPTVKGRYIYGDFTVAASYTRDSVLTYDVPGTVVDELVVGDTEWQVGAGYTFGNYSVGGAYGQSKNAFGTSDKNKFWTVSFNGELGAFGFSLLVADSTAQDDIGYGASINYDIGAATSLRAVYSDNGMDKGSIGDLDFGRATYAVGARHNLGGGVTLAGGIGKNNFNNTIGDLGVIFNF